VVDLHEKGEAIVQVVEPAVVARASGRAELGTRVRARLAEADVEQGRVRFDILG
jgi:hypothetical protein